MKKIPLLSPYRRMYEAIPTSEDEVFGAKDIVDKTNCNPVSVGKFLMRCHENGLLKKVRRGRYQKTTKEIPEFRLPRSFITKNMWVVLNGREECLTLMEIVSLVAKRTKCHSLIIYGPISAALSYWHHSGCFEPRGKSHHFTYKLKAGISIRPTAPHNNSPTLH